jgi:hypothetical protein
MFNFMVLEPVCLDILRQKLVKLTAVANPKLGDHFLSQVIIIVSVFSIMILNEILLMSCLYSFIFIEPGGEVLCH